MGKRGEIYSTRLSSIRRTYFFNVHETFRGDLSLSIVESKSTDEEGKFDRQSVLVFEEDLDNFVQQFQKSIDVIKQEILKRKEQG